jgi:hypothetical protein
MGTLTRLHDFETDRDSTPPILISATKIDAEFDQIITESNAQDVRLDAAEAAGHVSTEDLADDAVDGTKIADDAIDSEHYTDGSIDLAHLSADSVDGTKIADDAIDSEHYTDGSIDLAHLSADSVDGTKIADDAIDSEHYTDGSIDNAHIADGAIDSEHYADGSIDLAHMSADSVDGSKIADDSIDSEHYVDLSIDSAHIGSDQIITAKILDSNVTLPKIVDATATNKVLGRVTSGSGNWEEVTLETTLSSTDEAIPTSKAVRDDIVSLVNDVGGFHAIADDQSFPNTNPDPDDGAGTVVSIANAGGLVVNGSGVSTTGRTLGASTVTINGIPATYQSTTIADSLGMHVISTVTLNTYNYHKIIAKEGDTNIVATNIANVNTVAGISSDVTTVAGISANTTTVAGISGNVTTVAGISANTTTVAGISSNVTTVAGVSANVTTVAGISSDVTAVAGKATEVGLLGTSAAVADMAILGDADIVADMAALGATGVADDMETVADNVSSVTTTATNIVDVNTFATRYRILGADPSGTEGDMVFRTDTNKMRVHNGTDFQDVSPTSANNVFGTVAVATQSDIIADNTAATLTFAGTGGTTITTNAGTDTLTIDTPAAGASAGFAVAMAIAL